MWPTESPPVSAVSTPPQARLVWRSMAERTLCTIHGTTLTSTVPILISMTTAPGGRWTWVRPTSCLTSPSTGGMVKGDPTNCTGSFDADDDDDDDDGDDDDAAAAVVCV